MNLTGLEIGGLVAIVTLLISTVGVVGTAMSSLGDIRERLARIEMKLEMTDKDE